jgi:hypothetical protein
LSDRDDGEESRPAGLTTEEVNALNASEIFEKWSTESWTSVRTQAQAREDTMAADVEDVGPPPGKFDHG